MLSDHKPDPYRRVRRKPVGERVTLDRTRHATRAGPAAAELGPPDRDHLDPVVPQPRVRLDVALVGDDHARRQCEHVVAVLPLLPLGLVAVAAGLEQPHLWQVEHPRDRREQLVLVLDGDAGWSWLEQVAGRRLFSSG
jgi:hypothetical protein